MSATSPFTKKIATTYGLIFVVAFAVVFAVGCSPPTPPKARVSRAPAAQPAIETATKAAPAAAADPDVPAAEAPPQDLGAVLYAQHCAACHGERGDGQGIAAKVLFPKPRDFQAGRFRLVSTSSNVPSREDLQAVLIRGMPGSSLSPWKHLTQVKRDALVSEVIMCESCDASVL